MTRVVDGRSFAPDPDGTLIPIPMEVPQGSPIRDDASFTMNARTDNGY